MVVSRRAANQMEVRSGVQVAARCENSRHPPIVRRTLPGVSIVEGALARTNNPATDSIRVQVEPAFTRSVRVRAMQTMRLT
jgi:hypothetical protein